MSTAREMDVPFENSFMMRVVPYNTTIDSDLGHEFLIVHLVCRPGNEWRELSKAINDEVAGALSDGDIPIGTVGRWEVDFTDLFVLWCDPGDWWTDMTKISERNCGAVLAMMRERGHTDAISIRVLFTGE